MSGTEGRLGRDPDDRPRPTLIAAVQCRFGAHTDRPEGTVRDRDDAFLKD